MPLALKSGPPRFRLRIFTARQLCAVARIHTDHGVGRRYRFDTGPPGDTKKPEQGSWFHRSGGRGGGTAAAGGSGGSGSDSGSGGGGGEAGGVRGIQTYSVYIAQLDKARIAPPAVQEALVSRWRRRRRVRCWCTVCARIAGAAGSGS
jgi:hypothetical protein